MPANVQIYPEYFDRAWGFPVGNLLGDVRHKVLQLSGTRIPTVAAARDRWKRLSD